MGNPVSVTLSSIGVSRAVNLDWINAAPVNASVTGSSSGTFTYTVQATLDDLQLSSSPVWLDTSTAALTANSTLIVFLASPAGLRLSVTALSSAVMTLKVLQGVY